MKGPRLLMAGIASFSEMGQQQTFRDVCATSALPR